MTLKEAWESAKEGQKIKRNCSADDYTITKYAFDHGAARYDNDLTISIGSAMEDDWVLVPAKKTFWLNVYTSIYQSNHDVGCLHKTRQDADELATQDTRVACLEITYTPGEGLDG